MTKIFRTLPVVLLFALIAFTPKANAFYSPLSVAIIPPVQFPSSEYSVSGLRASVLWGDHRDVYGLDLGLIGNMTEQRFVGIGISGIFNLTKGDTTIILAQIAGLANLNVQKTNVYGIQAAIGINKNDAESKLVGIGVALSNLSPSMDIYGLQVGVYNVSRSVYGLQLGLINQTTNLHGLQIGLLNFALNGDPFKVSPILNFGF